MSDTVSSPYFNHSLYTLSLMLTLLLSLCSPVVLAPGAAVVVSSTVPPSAAVEINKELAKLPNKPVMVDAPVSGGAARAANGDLTIMASGEPAGLKKAGTVLNACTKSG